jgi:DNA-binding NtrC family response regulator
VNIAAIPEALVESELFGHVKGAYTGAATDRAGRFLAVQGGTIFIDEVGDLPLNAQPKLLRVLEDLTISPVGSDEEIQVDARVVAATSRNLPDLVAQGKFREDLYYRLNVITIQMPPLRERREDIPLLVDAFLTSLCDAAGRPKTAVDPSLLEFLEAYDWPGNVRELRNAIESMVVMTRRDVLTMEDLPPHIGGAQPARASLRLSSAANLEQIEKATILQALDHNSGNRTHAAAALGISIRTLQRKLKRWGLAAQDDDAR